MLLTNLGYIKRLYDADTGGAGGGTSTGEGGQPGSNAGTGTVNNSGGTASNSGGSADNSGGNGAGFTQADLDRVAGQTRKEALRRWAKELGFDDPAAIEAVIKAQKDADEKAKTDLQKQQEKTTAAETRAQGLETRLYDVILRAAFDRAAAEKVADLDLAYLAAREAKLLSSEAGVTVDVEAGTVAGVDKIVEKLLKDKPILKKAAQAAAAGTGGSEGGTPAPTELTAAQKADYSRRFGVRAPE